LTGSVPRIVVAGTQSGVGKTSFTLALVAAFRKRGLRVQTFKVGPDFLDPSYLTLASGRPCYNLDGWMTDQAYLLRLFERTTRDTDLAVVEGVMGLFDGADPDTSEGSTAEIARWLQAPVLLVANVHGMARSIAALVKGYAEFDPGLRVAGVVANQSGTDRHREWISASLASASLPPLLGAVPRGAFPNLPSRHLGLVTADRHNLSGNILDELAAVVDRQTNLEQILDAARKAPCLSFPAPPPEIPPPSEAVPIGVARDQAFHFYYQDNLDELARQGAVLVPCSPLADDHLPSGLKALYFGGGYPEEQATALSANRPFLEDVRRFAESGRPIYAECGGLMYLSRGIETRDGKKCTLAGLLPAWTRMLDRLKTLGYVEVRLTRDSLLGGKGAVLRGHEFHYSELLEDPTRDGNWASAYNLTRRRSKTGEQEGYQHRQTLASYVHLHWASRPEAARAIIHHCGAAL
jgi:cobyrinic acid a,c-diamide synthase